MDLDSTVCEVHGKSKQGAAYGHTKVWGYHPLAATRDDTGEVLHARMRSGSSQRGHVRFAAETLARLGRLAPGTKLTVRADAGFFSYALIAKLDTYKARWSVTIPQNAKVKAAIDGIDETAWTPIAYPDGEAQVAECAITTSRRDPCGPRKLRLVVRRTRLPEGPQRELWPDWRHHAFITNRDDLDTETADAYHRGHARVELAIRDLKDNGLAPLPLRKVLRQRRPPRLRRAGPQPHPLDRTTRTHTAPRTAHRSRHRPPAAARRARTPRQPQPPTQTPPPAQLALGTPIHRRAHTHPQPPPTHLNPQPRARRHPEHTP